jgi:hypothetical protein
MSGAHQAAQQEKTASVEFRQSRQSHPGVESAIGALQSGNGLERCRDRTERGFARYIGLGVLGRNLHVLGKLLIAREAPDCQAAHSRQSVPLDIACASPAGQATPRYPLIVADGGFTPSTSQRDARRPNPLSEPFLRAPVTPLVVSSKIFTPPSAATWTWKTETA